MKAYYVFIGAFEIVIVVGCCDYCNLFCVMKVSWVLNVLDRLFMNWILCIMFVCKTGPVPVLLMIVF